MKIRTTAQLQEFIDGDLSARKRELTSLRLRKVPAHLDCVLTRAGMCLAYAHLEGFVKLSATAFLNYVSFQGLEVQDVPPYLVALSFRSQLRNASQTNSVAIHTNLVAVIRGASSESLDLPWETAIDTKSNLNSKVLEEVLMTVGVEPSWYLTKGHWLDETLLKRRNEIAHGAATAVDPRDCDSAIATVQEVMERFRTDVQNCASLRTFKVA